MESTDEELQRLLGEKPARGTRELDPNDIIGGDAYRIIEKIGGGGMGVVYLAEDRQLKRRVALKRIRRSDDPIVSAGLIERFRREAVAAGQIHCPNVITIHAFKEDEGLLVMEYVEGYTLADEASEQGVEPARAVYLVEEILKGLEAMHAAGLTHRDIKPTNVLISPDPSGATGGRVVIADLGLVKRAGIADPARDFTLTQYGSPIGSPYYMAPEQIRASETLQVDPRADIYAVGIILFQLLTGQRPFKGSDAAAIYHQHLYEELPEIVSKQGVSEKLKAVVRKAAAKNPKDRFQSAFEMRVALRAALATPEQERQAEKDSNRILVATLIGAALIALIVGLSLLQWLMPPTSHAKTATAAVQASPVATLVPGANKPATTKAGCASYQAGQNSEAVRVLTQVLANASRPDADAEFCLCGAYVRQGLDAEKRQTCLAFQQHADPGDVRRPLVKRWLDRKPR